MTTLTRPPAVHATDVGRPGLASLLWRQVRYANTSFWRTPIAAFFTLLFPLIFLLLIGTVAGNAVVDPSSGMRLAQFLTPAMAVFGTAMAAFTTLAISVATDREAGVLKRLRGSPLPAWLYVVARITSAAYTALLGVLIVVLVGVSFYGVQIVWSKTAAGVLTLVVGISCFAALGLAVAAIVGRSEAVGAVTNGLLIPLSFISGVFAMGNELPSWLDRIAAIFPLKHFVDAMTEVFNPYHPGAGFMWENLAVMAAWAVAGGVVAVRFFGWEPRVAQRAAPRRGSTPTEHAQTASHHPGRVEEPGRPRMLALVAAQVVHANRAFWRKRAAAFFTVGFPVILVLLIPQVFGDGGAGQGVDIAQVVTPAMAVYGIAASSYLFLAQTVAAVRERAVLKRTHGTPLPVWAYVGGQMGAAVLMSLVSLGLVVGAGVAAYGVEIVWAKVPALLVYVVLGIGCFAALGIAVAAVAPSEKAAGTIANVTLLPLAFVSDIFIIAELPPVLDTIGWTFPLKHLANAVAGTFDPTIAGAGWDIVHLAALTAWMVGGVLLAARFFRWAPRRT